MVSVECISCGADIRLGSKPRMGQRVICTVCNTQLEVAWLDPVELDWPIEEEGFEDYDEYDYEED